MNLSKYKSRSRENRQEKNVNSMNSFVTDKKKVRLSASKDPLNRKSERGSLFFVWDQSKTASP